MHTFKKTFQGRRTNSPALHKITAAR